METSTELEALLARFVEHHVLHGESLAVEVLCAGRPDLAPALHVLVERYLLVNTMFDADPADADGPPAGMSHDELPAFDGFQTIERIGAGGMGVVYKLRDLTLDRLVAAKVIRQDRRSTSRIDTFLREARALALFSDRRIVQIHDARLNADPPVLIMEYVEGFELGRLAPSLDFAHRARILVEICEAVHHAHTLGLQHRDLKPSNIMVDAQLRPRILDFGLSAADASSGHLAGTPPYTAPEQLDPSRPIDARSDVHALGVILYELLCGRTPAGQPPSLPVEIAPAVPEPLQAIALTAMERDPQRRYQSALDMAEDLRRYLDGRRVLGRPSAYATTLGARVEPHVNEIREWARLKLVHPHEAERLQSAYASLSAPEDDWIVEGRVLTFAQIALYLGAFLLIAGSLFYFVAARWYETVHGVARPFLVLALPFIGLNAAAHLLYHREHKAVAVAFYLSAIALLPLFLLIFFYEARWFVAADGAPGQLFNRAISNRQLQLTTLLASAWCGWLAVRTRTAALSTTFAVLLLLVAVALAADFGLRDALDDGRWDSVALRFVPLMLVYGALGFAAERFSRRWLSRPLYLGAAVTLVMILELIALNGQALRHLGGFSLAPWQAAEVSDSTLLDTVAAMTINGAVFYWTATLLATRGTPVMGSAAQLLFTIAPFALIHPLGYLVRTGEYSPRVDWFYASCALVLMLLSERRQRKSFYYAGLLNLGAALFYIASHRQWFERPAWAITVIVVGLTALAAGFVLDRAGSARRG
jgi:predicted Ser/Thr protein kinase